MIDRVQRKHTERREAVGVGRPHTIHSVCLMGGRWCVQEVAYMALAEAVAMRSA